MSTRSQIGILHRDGSITAHYCHSDGYFSWNGRLLHTHYQDRKKIQRLIDLGTQTMLAENIGTKHDFDWATKIPRSDGETIDEYMAKRDADPRSKMCLFWHRDRGEKGDWKPMHFASIEDCAHHFEQYAYLYDEARGAWIGCKTNRENVEDLQWHLLSDLAEADWNDGIEDFYDTTTQPSVRIVPLIDDSSPEQIVKAMTAPANDVEAIDMDDPAARAIF